MVDIRAGARNGQLQLVKTSCSTYGKIRILVVIYLLNSYYYSYLILLSCCLQYKLIIFLSSWKNTINHVKIENKRLLYCYYIFFKSSLRYVIKTFFYSKEVYLLTLLNFFVSVERTSINFNSSLMSTSIESLKRTTREISNTLQIVNNVSKDGFVLSRSISDK